MFFRGSAPQALALAACYREEWPALVVVPPSLRHAWVAALGKWLGVPESEVVVVHKDAAKAKLSGRFNIVSYNLMAKVRTRSVPSTFERPLSSFRGRVGCEAPPNTPRQPDCATPPS